MAGIAVGIAVGTAVGTADIEVRVAVGVVFDIAVDVHVWLHFARVESATPAYHTDGDLAGRCHSSSCHGHAVARLDKTWLSNLHARWRAVKSFSNGISKRVVGLTNQLSARAASDASLRAAARDLFGRKV